MFFLKIITLLTLSYKTASPEKTRSGCKSGWENLNEKCYFFSSQAMTKPEAKKFCYDMNAGLLLVSGDSENAALSQKLNSGDSFWLRINDSKDEESWVVDRWGYEKPASWTPVSYFSQFENENTIERNSAVMNSDGSWSLVDKYATSGFACQMDTTSQKDKTLNGKILENFR